MLVFTYVGCPQPDLPLLLNATTIRQLTVNQAARYIIGYGLPNGPNVAARKREIALFVGCTTRVV